MGDAHKLRLRPQLGQAAGTHIAHARAQPAHQLEKIVGQIALVGHLPLDPFRDVFAFAQAVPVAGQSLHRAQRAHPPVFFEAAPFVDDQFAGRLGQAGQQAAKHHGVRTGGQGFDDVARVLDAAIGDDGDPVAVGLPGAELDGRDLGHAHSRHHPRGADGAGAHAHLDHVGPGGDQIPGAFGRHYVPGDQRQVGIGRLHPRYRLQYAGRVPVGSVDHRQVEPFFDPKSQAGQGRVADADGRPTQQPALDISGPLWIVPLLHDVLDGDQPFEHACLVHQGQLFDAMFLQDVDGAVEGCIHRRCDQLLRRGHQVVDGDAHVGHKPHVAVGEDAHQSLPVLGDRHTRDVVFAHDRFGIAHRRIGWQGDGIHDHARLAALDLLYLFSLPLHRQIAVQHAQAPLTRKGVGQAGFRDRVHGRRQHGAVEADTRRQVHTQVHLRRQHFGVARHQQHVVKGQGFRFESFSSHSSPSNHRSQTLYRIAAHRAAG